MKTHEVDSSWGDTPGQRTEAQRQHALQCLHSDLQTLAQRQLYRAVFERRWPATQIARWQWWQVAAQADALASLDLCCLLAYYAVDYDTNAARLVQARSDNRPLPASCTTAETGCQVLERLPGYLSLVYRKQRDPVLLHVLLELRMPSRSLRRIQWEAIAGLWDRHRIALLRAAAQSSVAQRTLLRAFIHVCRLVGEPSLWRAYYRHLQSATYRRDRQLTRTALSLMTGLLRAERHYKAE